MIFTPSSTSSVVSGMGFWATVWALVFKADTFAKTVKYNKPVRGPMLDWIGQHPIETVTMTELVNYSIHGLTNPLAVFAALGGTIVNTIATVGLAIRWHVFRKRSINKIKLSVAKAA